MEHVVDQLLAKVKTTDTKTSEMGKNFQTESFHFKIWTQEVNFNWVHGIKMLTHHIYFLFLSYIYKILTLFRLKSLISKNSRMKI